MVGKDSFESRYDIFLSAAVIAAHSTSEISHGFRQRDVRFFVMLFLNWFPIYESRQNIQNTQILRYLKSLNNDGLLKIHMKRSTPRYRLSRTGLMELLGKLVSPARSHVRHHFLFILYFLVGYGALLIELVEKEGSNFPPILRIELRTLLDAKNLLNQEISAVEREVAKIELRMETATRVSELVKARSASGVPFAEIVYEVEKRHPYDMNTTIPLSKLLETLQPKQRMWEIQTGDTLRRDILWKPEQALTKAYLLELKRLRGEYLSLVTRGVG